MGGGGGRGPPGRDHIQGVYWDNRKENGNYYLWLRV